MILNIISFLIISFTLYSAFSDFRKDKSLIKKVYLERPKDYLWSILLFFGVSLLVLFCVSIDMPKIFTWTWFSLFSTSETSGNVLTKAFNSSSLIFIVFFWILMVLSLPYLAKIEEESFRYQVFNIKSRILTNLKFGLLHMIMGVPLFVAIILWIVGYFFSVMYVYTFNKNFNSGVDYDSSNELALHASTSLHTKYNLIIITLAAVFSSILLYLG